MNITDELHKLQSLRESGALTDDEFNMLKARLLNTNTSTSTHSTTYAGSSSINQFIHTITRSRADSWLGGVCGGLSRKTDLPSWVWRLIFTVSAFAYSLGVIIYILLWIFVPLEENNLVTTIRSNDSNATSNANSTPTEASQTPLYTNNDTDIIDNIPKN